MDIINILLIIIVVIDFILVILAIIGNNKKDNITIWYLINITTIAWWSGSMVFFRLSNPENILILTKLLYVSATTIASSFFYFSYIFPKTKEIYWRRMTFVGAINLLLIYLTIFGDNIIVDAKVNPFGENIIYFGKLYVFYVLYILYLFLSSFIRLFLKYRNEKNPLFKAQIFLLFIGYSLSGNIAFVSNLILPWLHYFSVNWLGQVATICMATTITYAATRHKLFNLRVISAELFIFALWIFALIRILVANNLNDQVTNIIFLILVMFIGYFLIKGVLKEVSQREQIQKLAQDLEHANAHLKDLDKMKTEFVSLATHQIRAPLTAIKGYISLIQEGDYGPVSPEINQAVTIIYNETNSLVTIVADFLDVSRIEQGRMKYEFSDFDAHEVVDEVIREYKPNVEKKGLTFTYESGEQMQLPVHADKGKLKQVIGNILDNSIKYTPHGYIKMSLGLKDNNIIIEISDSGVGIPANTIPKLFQKFTRAANANETNILGTGLGLYVAKNMIESMNGKVWAESEGEGKGAQFYIQLPLQHQTATKNNQKTVELQSAFKA